MNAKHNTLVLSNDLLKHLARKHANTTFQRLSEIIPAEDRVRVRACVWFTVKLATHERYFQPQIILLAGEVTPYRNDTDREMPFRQVCPSILRRYPPRTHILIHRSLISL